MPLYSYKCEACEAEFELLVRASEAPSCPSCGSSALTQQIARISADIRYPRIAKSWRQAAARSGDLSNFSAAERKL
ncbi:MAG TPA: zinc ribbon domain-containing protein [Methylocystis sp.]|nr:zinc ribbon domain-containing protein [Methylocystis sp.]